MFRALLLACAIAVLAGCAAPSYRYYGERYVDHDGYPVEDTRYVGGGVGYHEPDSLYWADYPAYYSLFWTLNRSYVDPFWHPNFYYGVTWFPRNYYSVVYRSWYGPRWYGRPWYGYLAYSPYRLSWVDHYYDWYPWYAYNPRPHYHYAPRYGGVRNEAERLARYNAWRNSDAAAGYGYAPRGSWSAAARSQNAVENRREALRGADYGGRSPRLDPGVSGFRQGDTRYGAGTPATRRDPGVSGFQTPRAGEGQPRSGTPRYADPAAGGRSDPRVSGFQTPRETSPGRYTGPRQGGTAERGEGIPYPARSTSPVRQVESLPREAPRYREVPRSGATERSGGYSVPAPRYSAPRESSPRYSEPVQRDTPRYAPPARSEPRYSEAAPRYAPPARQEPRYSAPEPSYSAPREQPRYEQPRYQAPEPRYEAPARSEPRYEMPSREPVDRGGERGGREGDADRRSDE
jgi:hypothetical protein